VLDFPLASDEPSRSKHDIRRHKLVKGSRGPASTCRNIKQSYDIILVRNLYIRYRTDCFLLLYTLFIKKKTYKKKQPGQQAKRRKEEKT
jgi:hypothetical protein